MRSQGKELTKEEIKQRNEEAEKKRQAEEAEKAKKKEAERFNRQINYFVMRYMWQVIHGRDADDTIYNALGMSRLRYTRIIDTGVVRYRRDELKGLEKATGINREIFTGEKRFICHNKKDMTQTLISSDDWKKLFELRDNRREQTTLSSEGDADGSKGKYKECENEITKNLREAARKGNGQFCKLCDFLKSGHAAKEERLRDAEQSLGLIGVSLLDDCTAEELVHLSDMLKKKLELVSATLIYRRAKSDFQKK